MGVEAVPKKLVESKLGKEVELEEEDPVIRSKKFGSTNVSIKHV